MVGRSVVERLDRAREAVSEAQSERARANAYVVLILQTTCARACMDANACVWMGGVVMCHHQDGFWGRSVSSHVVRGERIVLFFVVFGIGIDADRRRFGVWKRQTRVFIGKSVDVVGVKRAQQGVRTLAE